MFFAATYPERTTSLVLINAYARYGRSEETPWGLPDGMIPPYVAAIQDVWGTGACIETLAPTMVSTEEARRHWAPDRAPDGQPGRPGGEPPGPSWRAM